MLQGLDQVDWHSLNAEDIPDKLLSLLSPKNDDREKAFFYLLYELADPDIAEGYGTPPEILSNELKAIVVGFLQQILNAPYPDTQAYALGVMMTICYLFKREIYVEPYLMRLQQLRQRLESGIHLYLDKLTHDDVQVRYHAVKLILKFPAPSPKFVESLLDAIPVESDFRLQMLQIWTVLHLVNGNEQFLEMYSPEFIDLLERLIVSTESYDVKVIIGVVLANLKREATSEVAVDAIIQGLIALEENGKYLAFESYEWRNDQERLIEALTLLDRERSTAAFFKVMLNDATPILNVFYALDALLQLYFGLGEYSSRGIYEHEDAEQTFIDVYPQLMKARTTITQFSEAQRELLHTLITVPSLQEFRTNLFENYGLPVTIDRIKKLLAGQQ